MAHSLRESENESNSLCHQYTIVQTLNMLSVVWHLIWIGAAATVGDEPATTVPTTSSSTACSLR